MRSGLPSAQGDAQTPVGDLWRLWVRCSAGQDSESNEGITGFNIRDCPDLDEALDRT
jgi:hypothetical protein